MVLGYLNLNTFEVLYIEAHFNIQTLNTLTIECISFQIKKEKLKGFVTPECYLSANNVVQFVGEYYNFNEYYIDYIDFSISNFAKNKKLKEVYSYNCFYSTLRNPFNRTHFHDVGALFSIKSVLMRANFECKINDYKVDFVLPSSMFYLKNLNLKAFVFTDLWGVIKNAKLFFMGCDFPTLTRLNEKNEYTGMWTNSKNHSYYITNKNYFFRIPLNPYIGIGNIPVLTEVEDNYTIEEPTTISLNYIIKPFVRNVKLDNDLLPVTSKEQHLNISLLYNLNSVYSLKLKYKDTYNLKSLTSACLHIIPVVAPKGKYRIIDTKDFYKQIFEVSKVKSGNVVNLNGVSLYLCDMWGIYQLNVVYGETSEFILKTKIDKIEALDEIIGDFADLNIVIYKKIINLRPIGINNLIRLRIYSTSEFQKKGIYRSIRFNKVQKKPNKAVPFYETDWVKLVNYSMTNIIFDNLISGDAYKSMRGPYKKIFHMPIYYSLKSSSCIGKLSLIKKGIGFYVVNKNNNNTYNKLFVYLYSNNGQISGYLQNILYSSDGLEIDKKTISSVELIYLLNVYLHPSYRRAAYIFKTKQDGTFDWDEETMEHYRKILLSEDVIKANNECKRMGISPYGIRKVVGFELSKKEMNNVYYFDNKETHFNYKGVEYYIDTYPIEKQNVFYSFLKNYEFIKNVGSSYCSFTIKNEVTTINSSKISIEAKTSVFYLHKSNFYIKSSDIRYLRAIDGNKEYKVSFDYFSQRIMDLKPVVKNFVSTSKLLNLHNFKYPFYLQIIEVNIKDTLFDYYNVYINMPRSLNPYYSKEQKFRLDKPIFLNEIVFKDIFRYKFIHILKKYKGVYSNVFHIKIAQRKTLKEVYSKYDSVWMQIYFSNYSDMAMDETILFLFNKNNDEFGIDMPIRHGFIDEVGGVEEIKKDKYWPSFLQDGEPEYGKFLVEDVPNRKAEPTRDCINVYNKLSYSGFDFEIERDDKVLVGNLVYKTTKRLYGSNIEEKQSLMVEGRSISDNGMFHENLQEHIAAIVDKEKVKDFREEDMRFTEEDLKGYTYPNEYIKSLNNQLIKGVEGVNTSISAEDVVSTQDEQVLSEETIEEIRRYIDDLGDVSDSIVYDMVPTRPIIDGKLLKKIIVPQNINITDREE